MGSAEGTARPRKRHRANENADDTAVVSGSKKARGRPRVDTQDATAADRRRTQIRLAQRAYRQRKETTISSLKQRNTQLHTIIDQMNKSFSHFNTLADQSRLFQLNSEIAKEFKQVIETFASCVKSANGQLLDSDEEEFGETGLTQETQDPAASAAAVPQTHILQTVTPPAKEQAWGYTTTIDATEQTRSQFNTSSQSYFSHISSSYYNLPDSNDQSSLVNRQQFRVNDRQGQSKSTEEPYSQPIDLQFKIQQQIEQPLPFGLVDLPSREQSPFVPTYFFPVDTPAMGVELPAAPRLSARMDSHPPITLSSTKSLSPPFTYSFHEVTFARRLMRATLEAAFLLLSTANTQSALLKFKFKLSLPYLTIEEIRSRFKIILSRGVTEDLDWYATPFLHLGGAGTHYQRRDASGKPIPLKNTWTVRQIGPLDRRMLRLENTADGQVQHLEGVDLMGYEGEWFDAYDVQGYLEEQWHCKIDPRSSFAECLVEDNSTVTYTDAQSPSLSHGSTASTKGYPVTPPVPSAFNAFEPSYGLHMSLDNAPTSGFIPAIPRQSMLDLSFDQTLGLDLAPGFDMGFAGGSGYSLNMLADIEQPPVVRQSAKKTAWVDVSRLMESTLDNFEIFRPACILTGETDIIKQAVCLGRAPGYRREDIDVAVRAALITAF